MCKYLYHYTTLGVLQKIFNDPDGKTIELKLKDYHFLNDEHEGKWLVRFLNECKKNIVAKFEENEKFACEKAIDDFVEGECYRMLLREQNDKHYSFSMSELRDSTLFWRQDYAKDNGVALRTEKIVFENKSKWPVEPILYLGVDTVKKYLPDFVGAVKQDAQYVKCQADLRNESPEDSISGMLEGAKTLTKTDFLKLKNIIWEAEKEWRIIVTHKSDGKEDLLKKDGVEIDENFVPRYKLKIENPFDEIILGPSFSKYYVESVSKWLKQNKYDKIRVSQSLGCKC